MNLSLKQSLITIVTSLLLTACTGDKGSDHAVGLLDVAQAAARGSDRVSVGELADWIVQSRADFALIDVRSEGDFNAGAIGDARNVSVAELLGNESLSTLPRDRKLVLYSNGSENSAKAATLLRVAGFDAQVLSGGYNAWQSKVLNPDISPEELDGESLLVSEQRALACYFVGDQGAGGARRPEVEFVPPVFETDEELDDLPLPPAGKESC